MSPLISIIVASFITSLIALAGIMILKKASREKLSYYLISFAAGVMLTTAFTHLLPEASEEAGEMNIFLPALFGIISFFFIERFILWFHHHDVAPGLKPSAILVLLGDGLHNFFDGIAIAAAFLTNPALGFTTTIAIIAHELPHELADFSILVHSGMSKNKALFANFISALTAVLGGILGYFFLSTFEAVEPLAVAFIAGIFIYIACSDLIPEVHKEFNRQKRFIQSIAFVAGAITIYLVGIFIEH